MPSLRCIEKIDKNFNLVNFGKNILIKSKVQVIIVKSEENLVKFLKKILLKMKLSSAWAPDLYQAG